jgi:ribonuclease T2
MRVRLFGWLLAIHFAALMPTLAGGQERRNAAPGVFDFYVLALSWSPGFCALTDRRDREQCAPDSELGFVLHGLWPQFGRGYPADCDDRRRPTRAQISGAVPPYPTEGLVRHQWRKHGSCSGLDPERYFALARQAFEKVKLPTVLSTRNDMEAAPIDIEQRFAEVNPGLRPDGMSVQCRRGLFQEIRICLAKDLGRFVSCPEVDQDACRSRSIRIAPR